MGAYGTLYINYDITQDNHLLTKLQQLQSAEGRIV